VKNWTRNGFISPRLGHGPTPRTSSGGKRYCSLLCLRDPGRKALPGDARISSAKIPADGLASGICPRPDRGRLSHWAQAPGPRPPARVPLGLASEGADKGCVPAPALQAELGWLRGAAEKKPWKGIDFQRSCSLFPQREAGWVIASVCHAAGPGRKTVKEKVGRARDSRPGLVPDQAPVEATLRLGILLPNKPPRAPASCRGQPLDRRSR